MRNPTTQIVTKMNIETEKTIKLPYLSITIYSEISLLNIIDYHHLRTY